MGKTKKKKKEGRKTSRMLFCLGCSYAWGIIPTVAKIGEYRLAVGMLNPTGEKNEGTHVPVERRGDARYQG